MPYYVCLDRNCKLYNHPIYSQRSNIFSHYLRKLRITLNAISVENSLADNPEFEDRYSLINKIVDASLFSQDEDVEQEFSLSQKQIGSGD